MLNNIDIKKYPRNNSEKKYTDLVIIIFLKNKDFLEKLVKSVEKALLYFNQCKEYFYTFTFPNSHLSKTYSGKEICSLMKLNIIQVNKLQPIDKIYYFYYRNKNFYLNLFKAIEYSKKNYLNNKNYSLKINPPIDFYDKNIYLDFNYDMIEFLELLMFSNKIKNNNLLKLPFPKCLKN